MTTLKEHEQERVRTMTDEQLVTRYGKMTKGDKIKAFYDELQLQNRAWSLRKQIAEEWEFEGGVSDDRWFLVNDEKKTWYSFRLEGKWSGCESVEICTADELMFRSKDPPPPEDDCWQPVKHSNDSLVVWMKEEARSMWNVLVSEGYKPRQK